MYDLIERDDARDLLPTQRCRLLLGDEAIGLTDDLLVRRAAAPGRVTGAVRLADRRAAGRPTPVGLEFIVLALIPRFGSVATE